MEVVFQVPYSMSWGIVMCHGDRGVDISFLNCFLLTSKTPAGLSMPFLHLSLLSFAVFTDNSSSFGNLFFDSPYLL
jgi:hypothetical protein